MKKKVFVFWKWKYYICRLNYFVVKKVLFFKKKFYFFKKVLFFQKNVFSLKVILPFQRPIVPEMEYRWHGHFKIGITWNLRSVFYRNRSKFDNGAQKFVGSGLCSWTPSSFWELTFIGDSIMGLAFDWLTDWITLTLNLTLTMTLNDWLPLPLTLTLILTDRLWLTGSDWLTLTEIHWNFLPYPKDVIRNFRSSDKYIDKLMKISRKMSHFYL